MPVLYHYCSTSTFLSIISSRSIRLSSLSLSNDTMEGKLVARIISRLASQDGIDSAAVKKIDDAVTFLENMFFGLGFCLLEEGDLLSQWRGYAADATGFSIGFSKKYLKSWTETADPTIEACVLKKVEYNTIEQEKLIKPTYDSIKEIVLGGKTSIHPSLRKLMPPQVSNTKAKDSAGLFMELAITVLDLTPKLFALKAAAFSEEKEWRLISYSMPKDDSCDYYPQRDRIVPFRAYDLVKSDTDSITEIKIGPKNLTPPHVLESLLHKYGFNNVTVSSSSATYR
jgi:hypothetical protein